MQTKRDCQISKLPKLIGITGFAGSGKDTTANQIIALYPRQCMRYAFAKPIKDGVKAMFGWSNFDIEDRVKKEQIDPKWGFSPREAMQKLGTQYGRNLLRDDIWILAAQNFYKESVDRDLTTIITDVRFENEAAWIRSESDSVILNIVGDKSITTDHESEKGIEFNPRDIIVRNDKHSDLNEGVAELSRTIKQIFNFFMRV